MFLKDMDDEIILRLFEDSSFNLLQEISTKLNDLPFAVHQEIKSSYIL